MRCRRLLRNLFLKSRRPSKCLDSPCSTFKAKNIWKKFLVGHPPNPPPTSMRGHQLMVRHNFAFELNNSKIFRCRTSKHSTSKFNFDASGLTEWLCDDDDGWPKRKKRIPKKNLDTKTWHFCASSSIGSTPKEFFIEIMLFKKVGWVKRTLWNEGWSWKHDVELLSAAAAELSWITSSSRVAFSRMTCHQETNLLKQLQH